MSNFILVVNEREFFGPGDNQRCSNYGYNTRHGPFHTYANYHCSKLGHTIVMNIWNIDAWQRQHYLTLAESCYFVSFSDKLSYLINSYMLLSEITTTMISTVKCKRNSIPFTIEGILKGEFNWNMYEITPPCYAINTYILHWLCFKQRDFLKEDLIGCNHANCRHATFGCWNIAFKFGDYQVIHTGASDLKLFVGGVCYTKSRYMEVQSLAAFKGTACHCLWFIWKIIWMIFTFYF